MWFFDQLQPGSAAYNVHFALRHDGPLDLGVLDRCVRELVRRHEVLRTVFPSVQGRPRQQVLERVLIPLALSDLRELAEGERDAAATRIASEEARAPFELADGPLLRVRVLHFPRRYGADASQPREPTSAPHATPRTVSSSAAASRTRRRRCARIRSWRSCAWQPLANKLGPA